MSASPVCSQCGKKVTAGQSGSPRALRCPECEKRRPKSAARARKPAKPAVRSPALLLLVSIGLILLVGGGIVALFLRQRAASAVSLASDTGTASTKMDAIGAHTPNVPNHVPPAPVVAPTPIETPPATDHSLNRETPPAPTVLTLDQEMDRLLANERLMTAEIDIAGVVFTMQVPEGAEISKIFKGAIVKKDSAFELLVDVGAADLAFVKERWKNDGAERLQSILCDKEDTLLGESIRTIDGKEKPSYHFVRNVALDSLTFHLRNSASTDALQPFARSDCLRMLACAGTIALKNTSSLPDSVQKLEEFGAALERDQNGKIVGMGIGTMPCSDAILARLPLARLMPALKRLDLSGAVLSDKGLKPLAALKNLRTLVLPESTVAPIHGTGLADLAPLTQLQDLTAANTAFTDEGLANLKMFPALKSLNLLGTRITGAGFETLKGPSRLQVIHLEGTRCNDAGLRHLGNLVGLRQLYLEATQVTDAGLQHLDRLTSLNILHLDDTAIVGSGFAALSGLAEMESLTLNRSRFSDLGLKNLAGMRKLTTLELASTAVTGAEFPILQKMNRLKFLFLRQTPVNDAGLARFPPLLGLQVLDLSGTQITDTGLQALKGLPNLHNLALQDTAITGSGLEGLRTSAQLVSLSLSRTRLRDEALAHLRPFKKLTALALAGTAVGDNGLAHLKGLNKLETLDLTGTATTDAGLDSLTDLKNLKLVQALRSKVTTEGANRFKGKMASVFLDVAD